MNEKQPPGVGSRWPEALVSALLMAAALLVISDSLRVGNGWADDGPQSGYFPFYVGVLLLGSSGSVLASTLLRWRGDNPMFADRAQLASVRAMLVPMVAYVAGIWLFGIHVASFVLVGFFMRRHGKYRWLATMAMSAAVPLTVHLVFERWFVVLLPKGPLERLLGI